MTTQWGHLPNATEYWGEVGISLKIANAAARAAEKDPKLAFKIHRNHLIDLIEEHHPKAEQNQRQADRLRARAARQTKAAERKVAGSPQAEALHGQAAELGRQANEYAAQAERHHRTEQMARMELASMTATTAVAQPVDDVTVSSDL